VLRRLDRLKEVAVRERGNDGERESHVPSSARSPLAGVVVLVVVLLAVLVVVLLGVLVVVLLEVVVVVGGRMNDRMSDPTSTRRLDVTVTPRRPGFDFDGLEHEVPRAWHPAGI